MIDFYALYVMELQCFDIAMKNDGIGSSKCMHCNLIEVDVDIEDYEEVCLQLHKALLSC